jgi:autotransporter-associated beta strand protein
MRLCFNNMCIRNFKIRIVFFICLTLSLMCSFLGRATTYYSDAAGGDPNNVNLWWTVADGTGTHPANFTSSTDVFYLKSGHTYTTTNAWNIPGTLQVYGSLTIQTANSIKILSIFSGGVVTASAQTTITASASGGQFNINNGGQYIFNHTTANNHTTLFAGAETFGTSSTIEFQNFDTSTGAFAYCIAQSASNFGNVIWNIQAGNTAYNLNYSSTTTRTIAGNFTISQTGASGSVAWCGSTSVGKLTVTGNFTQTAGTFIIARTGTGNDGATLEVLGNFSLTTGTFDMGSGVDLSYLYLAGNFTMTSGIFYYSYASAFGSGGEVYFTGSSTQTFTYSSGTWTTTYIPFYINSSATVLLASNMTMANTLTVSSGGTLNIPNPYYVTGSGTTTISSGAILKTGHVDGISTTASTGCVQTTTRSFSGGASIEYNGTSPQETGNAFTTTANLTLNNPTSVDLTQDLIISNAGTLTLTQGYHNLNGYTLSLGTSAAANSLVYTAGGLYAKDNSGAFKRWIPATTVTATSGNYYGLFPFAKSAGQLGTVKLTTTANVVGGYITIAPTFGYDTGVSCSVTDGSETIYRVQTGSFFTVTANTITSGTSVTLQYDCGIYLSASGATASDLCMATYTLSTVGILGTHASNSGSETSPQVRRTLTNMNLITAGVVCVLGSHDASNTLVMQCNLGGTKTVGPTGDYTRLTDALDAISASGINSSLILELQSTYTSTSESFPLKIDPFNCLGSSNTILIRPATGATGLTISKSNATAVISFDEGDYVTIDGRPGSTGTTSQLTITNTGSSGPAILFKKGATYNSVKYCTLEGRQTGTSKGTVEFTTYSSTANNYDTISNCTIKNYTGNTHSNAIYSVGDGTTKKNTSNVITSNNFVDCTSRGVYLDVHNDTWTISNNHFYQTAAITPGSTMYGIHIVNDGSGYTISGNYIGGQAASCGGSAYTLNSSANHYFPIYLSVTGTTTTTSIQGNVIRNIAFTNTNGTSTNPGIFTGIYVTGISAVNIGTTSGNIIGDTTANASNAITITSTVSGALIQGISVNSSGATYIQNNLIGDFATSNVSTKGYTFYGIRTIGSGACTISANKIGSYNTANSIQLGGALTGTGVCTFYGIHNASTGQPSIQTNYIQNCSVYGTGASLIFGIYNTNGSTGVTISSNNIGNLSNAYSGGTNTSAICVGIYQDAGVTTSISSNTIHSCVVNNGFFKGIYLNNTSGTSTVSSNTIGTSTAGNIAIASLSACTALTTNVTANHGGIVIGASTPNCVLTSNIVRSMTCSGALTYYIGGIVVGNAATPIVSLSSNTIEKIGCSNTGAYSSDIYGVYSGSTTTTSLTYKKNVIRNLFNRNTTSPNIYGFYDVTYNHSFINNFITVKNTDGTTSYTNSITLYGLWLNASSASKTTYIYYNTVEVGGSQAAGSNLSYTVYQNSNVATTLIYNNNLFQNARTGSSGIQYVYYGSHTTPTSTHSFNYLIAPSLTNFAYVGATKTSAQFLVAADDYGNSTSTATITAYTIGSDGSISDVSALTPGVDLHLTTDCTEDINGTVGNRASVSTAVHIGCYEGPVTIFYSAIATANTTAETLANWNSKTDATGVAPSDFTTAGYTFIVQSGHKYQVTSSWTGNATGYIQVASGGALDLNAQTLSTWGSIRISGTGVASSGALFNSSTSASSCSIPVTLEAASSILSSGTGGLTLTGNVTTSGFILTVDGSNATTISTGVISGTGGITKEGSGTLTLSGTNTYTGITTINNGTLSVATIGDGGVEGNLGQATNSVSNIVLGGGILKYTGSTATTDRAFSLTTGTTSTIQVNANTLTISGNSGNGTTGALTKLGSGTLVLSGNNTYTGLTTISAGILKLGSAGSGSNTPLGTVGSGTLVSSNGALDLAGYTLVTSEAITINGTGVSSGGAIMNSGGACTYSGLVTLGSTSSILGGSGTIALSNAGTITGSGYGLTLGGTQGGSIAGIIGTNAGALTKQDAGTWTLTGANTYTGATSISAGTINIQHATGFGTTAGGVTVSSGAAVEVQGGIAVGAEALSLNNDGVSSAGALRNVSGNNSWAGAITLTSNAVRINSDAGTLTLSGGISNSSVNLTIGGAGNVTSSGVIGTGSGNLIKDGAGTLTISATNTYTGTTTVSAGSIVLGAAQTSLTNDVVLTAGTFNAGGYAITTSGNWTNNGGTFTHGNNTVTLTGSGKTIGGTTSTTFYNLTNSGATTLGIATTVNNTMTLGNHLTLSTYDLTIGASGVFAGYDNTKFVVTNSTGKVTQNSLGAGAAAGKQVFPIGYSSASTDYTPCVIDNTGTTDNISVYVSSGRLASGTSGIAKTSNCVDRSWHVSEAVVGGSTVTMTLQWDVARELTSFTRTNCYIGHYNGASWDTGITAGSSTNVSGTIYEISRASISSFSPFDVEDPSALPITLIDFKATQEREKVRLDWETGTEENNDYFTVERSLDGKHFEKVFTKDGAGNSKTNLYYFGYDNNPYQGISYYRLKQTDFDGEFAYSDIESVYFNGNPIQNELKVFPNPVTDGAIHLEYLMEGSETLELYILNTLGQIVYQQYIATDKGMNSNLIKLPMLSEGLYQLKFGNDKLGFEMRNIHL